MKHYINVTGNILFPKDIEEDLKKCDEVNDKLFDEIIEVVEKHNCEVVMTTKLCNDTYTQEFVPHSVYRHFKGKYYASIDRSAPMDAEELEALIKAELDNEGNYSMTIQHTEEKKVIDGKEIARHTTAYHIDGKWYHGSFFDNKELSLYKSLYDNEITYARPMDMFLSPVEKDKHPDATQDFRFEIF